MKNSVLTLFCIIVIFSVYGTKASATSVKSSDYLPNKQTIYYKEGNGYYINAYHLKSKRVFANGYWHTYEYDTKKKKYDSYTSSKLKYVVKKDGVYTIDYRVNYDAIDRIDSKVLPVTLKKGMEFTTYSKSKGYPTTKSQLFVASINGTMRIKGKTYKNVVKIIETNKKEKRIEYWAKGEGIIKQTYTNGKSGTFKISSTLWTSKQVKW